MIQIHGASDSDAIQGKVRDWSRSVMSEAELTGLRELTEGARWGAASRIGPQLLTPKNSVRSSAR